MAPGIKTSQTIVLVAASLCLTCACGIGYRQPPYPPPPPVATISVHPSQLFFPNTVVGAVSPEQELVISNDSATAYDLSGVEIYSTFNRAFRIISTTCSDQLTAYDRCSVHVVFQPKTYIYSGKKPSPTYGIVRIHVTNYQVIEVHLEGTGTPAPSSTLSN